MQVEGPNRDGGDQSSIDPASCFFHAAGIFPLFFFPSRNDMDDMIQQNPFIYRCFVVLSSTAVLFSGCFFLLLFLLLLFCFRELVSLVCRKCVFVVRR